MKLIPFELEQVWGSCPISALIRPDPLLFLNAVSMTEGGEISGKKDYVHEAGQSLPMNTYRNLVPAMYQQRGSLIVSCLFSVQNVDDVDEGKLAGSIRKMCNVLKCLKVLWDTLNALFKSV